MPHINIKHFPQPLSDQEKQDPAKAISLVVQQSLGVDEGAISIALELVEEEHWDEQVYEPEVVGRSELLIKRPNY